MITPKRNIAIVGNIDSGKSTLTDYLTFISKYDTRNRRGSIEKGTTQTDIGIVEIERGITINSVPIQSVYDVNGQSYSLTIVDTPGHPEFGYQVKTILDGVEGALLLIDMNDLDKGFRNYSTSLLRQLRESNLPFITLLNKIDMVDRCNYEYDVEQILDEFEKAGLNLEILNSVYNLPSNQSYSKLSDGSIPALFTSGKTGHGGEELIEYIFNYFKDPSENALLKTLEDKDVFSGKVLNRIPKRGFSRGSATFRIISGSLKQGSRVYNSNTDEIYKLNHLYDVNGKALKEAHAGDIILLNLDKTNCASGHTLCQVGEKIKFYSAEIKELIIGTKLNVSSGLEKVAEVLKDLVKWDPSWSFETAGNDLMVYSSGTFHLGILVDILKKEYKLDLEASPFIPKYVAAPVLWSSVEGIASSKDQKYIIKGNLKNDLEGYYERDKLEDSDLKNSFTASNVGLDKLVKLMENKFLGLNWFDNFPLVGFYLELESGYSPTKKAGPAVKHKAINDAIQNILYESGNIALFEPYLKVQVIVSDKEKCEEINEIFRDRNLRPEYKKKNFNELKDLFEKDVKAKEVEDSDIMNRELYQRFMSKETISKNGIYHLSVELSLFDFMKDEFAFKRILNGTNHIIDYKDFRIVPYERAKQIIKDVCGEKKKGTLMRKKVMREGKGYENRVSVPRTVVSRKINGKNYDLPEINHRLNPIMSFYDGYGPIAKKDLEKRVRRWISPVTGSVKFVKWSGKSMRNIVKTTINKSKKLREERKRRKNRENRS